MDSRGVEPGSQFEAVDDRAHSLMRLFPEAIADGRIDWDVLRACLGEWVDNGSEHFGLGWPGKAASVRAIQEATTATLRPDFDESSNWDSTQNVVIEGDNLEVLKVLQRSYHSRVKMIYIDPPYNTGKEFIYPDNYKEGLAEYLRYSGQTDPEGRKLSANAETDGRYHSKWLSMMYPRLFLARNLLREDGVIFASIDDHEVHNLRAMMNEIFGESNLLATFIWKRKAGGGDDSDHVAAEHDYVLCYARDEARCSLNTIMHESPAMTAKYNKEENGRRYYLERLDKTSLTYSSSMDFAIECPDGSFVEPPQPDPERPSTAWRWSEATVQERRDELVFKRDEKAGEWRVYTRTWESLDGVTPRSLLVEKEHGRNRDGTQELTKLLGPRVFTNPKPTKFLRHLLSIATSGGEDEIVLDFFAGSGSTGHAVLEQNAIDGGSRSFLLVQLPEPTDSDRFRSLARITAERVRVAAASISGGELKAPDRWDGGFRFYSLGETNFRVWDPRARTAEEVEAQLELSVAGTRELAERDSIVAELLLRSGFGLTCTLESLEVNGISAEVVGDGDLILVVGGELTLDALDLLVGRRPSLLVVLDRCFADDDELKVNAMQTVRAANQGAGTNITLKVV